MSRRSEKKADEAAREQSERDSFLETVESFVVAFILAFVFRAYVVEAFVIPTGSMAPRLNGEHYEFVCDECGYHYNVGQDKSPTASPSPRCPMCHAIPRCVCGDCGATFRVDPRRSLAGMVCPKCKSRNVGWPTVSANAGDRILVLKYMYDFFEPRRWDVIVFKYPNDPSQNYIKRLIGLPGDKIEVIDGDVYVNDRIAPPKPDRAQESLWMAVSDTQYEDPTGKPLWHAATAGDEPAPDATVLTLSPAGGETAWLNYQYLDENRRPAAIRDLYAYDAPAGGGPRGDGQNIVVDLRLRADVELQKGAAAEIVLTAYQDEFRFLFPAADSGGKARILRNEKLIAEGPADIVPASGKVCLEAANVDHGLVLKVNGRRVIDVNGDGRFDEQDNVAYDVSSLSRMWDGTEQDIAKVRFGVQGAAATVHRLRVDRDVYYTNAYDHASARHGRGTEGRPCQLAADEFFVMGDNSPNSADSRRWENEPVVPRDNLIGKAFFVYWPSAGPVPGLPIRIVPKVTEFRFIR